MSQPNNILDREYSKFVDSPTRANQSAVETQDTSNRFAPPANSKYFERSVAGSIETFSFYDVEGGTLLKEVVLTYTSSSLENLVKGEVNEF